jgi:hypothetical protein
MVFVIGGGCLFGVVFGLVMENIVFAVFEALLFLIGGLAALRLGPVIKPPSPKVAVRPPLGTSESARRRRRDERIGMLASGLPLVGLLVVLAVVVTRTEIRLALVGGALVLASLYARGLWLIGTGTEASDRRRLRAHERQVRRLDEDRRWYEENVDPLRQRRRMARAGKVMVGLFAIPTLLLLVALPGALTEDSGSSAVRTAGAVASVVLSVLVLVGGCAALIRRAQNRRAAGDL